jgi:putative glycosyltransferase
MKISVVTTLYRSAATVDEFYRRTMRVAESIADDVELILVDDGSPDESLRRAIALHESDPRVIVIELARNFGHHKAMMTGLTKADGDLVFLIDSDLEEEPELLRTFYSRLIADDCDVVYGFQESRRGGILERATGALYYSLLNLLSDDKIPRNLLTVRLMKRNYVRALVRYRDREFVIAQLWSATGFRQVGIAVRKLSTSVSSYSLRTRAEYFVKHVTTSSTKLLYLFFYIGAILSVLAACMIAYYMLRYVFSGIGVSGFTSVIVSIWFFGGLLMLVLGAIGVYVANILSESKRRPYTVVRRVYKDSRRPSAKSLPSDPTRVMVKEQ